MTNDPTKEITTVGPEFLSCQGLGGTGGVWGLRGISRGASGQDHWGATEASDFACFVKSACKKLSTYHVQFCFFLLKTFGLIIVDCVVVGNLTMWGSWDWVQDQAGRPNSAADVHPGGWLCQKIASNNSESSFFFWLFHMVNSENETLESGTKWNTFYIRLYRLSFGELTLLAFARDPCWIRNTS